MIYIGCHLSTTDGYPALGKMITAMGGNTFAWFTRNPRGGRSNPPKPADVAALSNYAKEQHLGPLVAHASYTMNLCSSKESTRRNGLDMLQQDIRLMRQLPGDYYNFHPGCHTGQGVETGIQQIADALNAVLAPDDRKATVLLETMTGKGSEIGGCFEELKAIIDRVEQPIGVCFDTCHTWDAGYDIVDDLDGVLTHFDTVIGLDRLKAIHFNDSKNERGSRKDRHEKLGQGRIGLDALKRIACHPALQGLPFILETPNDDAGYIREIALVKEWFA